MGSIVLVLPMVTPGGTGGDAATTTIALTTAAAAAVCTAWGGCCLQGGEGTMPGWGARVGRRRAMQPVSRLRKHTEEPWWVTGHTASVVIQSAIRAQSYPSCPCAQCLESSSRRAPWTKASGIHHHVQAGGSPARARASPANRPVSGEQAGKQASKQQGPKAAGVRIQNCAAACLESRVVLHRRAPLRCIRLRIDRLTLTVTCRIRCKPPPRQRSTRPSCAHDPTLRGKGPRLVTFRAARPQRGGADGPAGGNACFPDKSSIAGHHNAKPWMRYQRRLARVKVCPLDGERK